MIQVMIADDHAVVRQGIRRILSEAGVMEIAGEAANVNELKTLLHSLPLPQAIVLDLSLPGKSGFEALIELKDEWPHLPVLILSVHPEEQYALRALKAGASGYLSKECAPEQLVQAVRTIVRGQRYITSGVADLLASHLQVAQSEKARHTLLSDREFQVLILLGEGQSLTEIAKRFCVSVKTVSTYRSRLLQKMTLRNNAEIAQYVMKNELQS